MSLFSDPERWARSAAGSVQRMTWMIVGQVCLCSMLFLRAQPLSFVVPMVILIGVWWPGMYLYAMFRLIKRVDELQLRASTLEDKLKERGS